MQDVDVAVKELEFAMTERGACGVMIDDHVLGTPYDDPRFRPFWEAAEELGALLLLHQHGTLVDARAGGVEDAGGVEGDRVAVQVGNGLQPGELVVDVLRAAFGDELI